MDCQQVDRLLSAYIDREVSPTESREVRLHLEECLVCRSVYLQLVKGKEALSLLGDVSLTSDFHPRFVAKLQQDTVENTVLKWFERLRPMAFASALGLLFAVIGLPLIQGARVAKVEPFSDLHFLLAEHRRLQQSEPFTQLMPPVIDQMGFGSQTTAVSVARFFEQTVLTASPGTHEVVLTHHL